MYQFNVNASGPVDAFSFSFTVPTFVGDGATPAFTPFTVTDGTHSWMITKDLASQSTATGTYGILLGSSIFDFAGGQEVPHLTGSLNVSSVSSVPEPTSILLLGSIPGVVGWRVRRRVA